MSSNNIGLAINGTPNFVAAYQAAYQARIDELARENAKLRKENTENKERERERQMRRERKQQRKKQKKHKQHKQHTHHKRHTDAGPRPLIFFSTARDIACSLAAQIQDMQSTFACILAQCRSGKTGAILFIAFLCHKRGLFKQFQILLSTNQKGPKAEWKKAIEKKYDVQTENGTIDKPLSKEFNRFLARFLTDPALSPGGEPFLSGHQMRYVSYDDSTRSRTGGTLRILDEADYGDGADQLVYRVLDKLRQIEQEEGSRPCGRQCGQHDCMLYVSATQTEIAKMVRDNRSTTAFAFHRPAEDSGYVGISQYLRKGKIKPIVFPRQPSAGESGAEEEEPLPKHQLLLEELKARSHKKRYTIVRLTKPGDREAIESYASSIGYRVVNYFDQENGGVSGSRLSSSDISPEMFRKRPHRPTVVFVKAKLSRGEEIPVKKYITLYWNETSRKPESWSTALQYIARLFGYKNEETGCLCGDLPDIYAMPEHIPHFEEYARCFEEADLDAYAGLPTSSARTHFASDPQYRKTEMHTQKISEYVCDPELCCIDVSLALEGTLADMRYEPNKIADSGTKALASMAVLKTVRQAAAAASNALRSGGGSSSAAAGRRRVCVQFDRPALLNTACLPIQQDQNDTPALRGLDSRYATHDTYERGSKPLGKNWALSDHRAAAARLKEMVYNTCREYGITDVSFWDSYIEDGGRLPHKRSANWKPHGLSDRDRPYFGIWHGLFFTFEGPSAQPREGTEGSTEGTEGSTEGTEGTEGTAGTGSRGGALKRMREEEACGEASGESGRSPKRPLVDYSDSGGSSGSYSDSSCSDSESDSSDSDSESDSDSSEDDAEATSFFSDGADNSFF